MIARWAVVVAVAAALRTGPPRAERNPQRGSSTSGVVTTGASRQAAARCLAGRPKWHRTSQVTTVHVDSRVGGGGDGMWKLFVSASNVNHTGNSSQHMKLEQLEYSNPAHERTRPQSLLTAGLLPHEPGDFRSERRRTEAGGRWHKRWVVTAARFEIRLRTTTILQTVHNGSVRVAPVSQL